MNRAKWWFSQSLVVNPSSHSLSSNGKAAGILNQSGLQSHRPPFGMFASLKHSIRTGHSDWSQREESQEKKEKCQKKMLSVLPLTYLL